MEDYAEDMLYIAMKLNLTSLIHDITKVQNGTPGKKESSATRMKDYLSQLSPEARQKLYYFYKIDFEMFEYDHDFVYDYYEYGWISVDLQFPSFLPLPPSQHRPPWPAPFSLVRAAEQKREERGAMQQNSPSEQISKKCMRCSE